MNPTNRDKMRFTPSLCYGSYSWHDSTQWSHGSNQVTEAFHFKPLYEFTRSQRFCLNMFPFPPPSPPPHPIQCWVKLPCVAWGSRCLSNNLQRCKRGGGGAWAHDGCETEFCPRWMVYLHMKPWRQLYKIAAERTRIVKLNFVSCWWFSWTRNR